jgi:hypothetical protein
MSWPSYVTCNLPICGAGRVDLVDARHRFGSAPHIEVRHIHCVMCLKAHNTMNLTRQIPGIV